MLLVERIARSIKVENVGFEKDGGDYHSEMEGSESEKVFDLSTDF